MCVTLLRCVNMGFSNVMAEMDPLIVFPIFIHIGQISDLKFHAGGGG